MNPRVFLSIILLSVAVSSALAVTCKTCNLTTTRAVCMQNYQTTNCDNVKLDQTNQTADSCYTMNGTKMDGSTVFIQHCTLKAGCDYICDYFNRTHLSSSLKTCETRCFVEGGATPTPTSSTNPGSTTQTSPTTTGTRFELAFGLMVVPIFVWFLH